MSSNTELRVFEGHERLATLRISDPYIRSSERKRAHENSILPLLAENKDYVIDISITMNIEFQSLVIGMFCKKIYTRLYRPFSIIISIEPLSDMLNCLRSLWLPV